MFPSTHRISIRNHLGPESQSVLHYMKAEFSPQRRARPTWGTGLGQQRLVEGPWAGPFASGCGDRSQNSGKWKDCPHGKDRNAYECLEAPCHGTGFGSIGHRTVDGVRCGFLCPLHMSSGHTRSGTLEVPKTLLLILSGMWELCGVVWKCVTFVCHWWPWDDFKGHIDLCCCCFVLVMMCWVSWLSSWQAMLAFHLWWWCEISFENIF